MRRRTLALSAVVLVAALAWLSRAPLARLFAARSGGGAPARVGADDLRRTREFLDDWARRSRWDSFPESPAFAFYNVYATEAVAGETPPAVRGRVIDFLRRCQASDGGFTQAPGLGASHVVPTYHALRTLALLGALDQVDRQRAGSFLAALSAPDGGFRGSLREPEGSLGTTFHAVASLATLGALDRVDRARTRAYVESHREPGRGYALLRGKCSTPGATFMAVRLLTLLGGVSDPQRQEVAQYLAATRYSGNVRDERFTMLPQLDELAAVLEAMDDLGALGALDRGAIERFLSSLYVQENGGFGPEPGLGTTPPATATAVECLVRLGRLRDPFETRRRG